MAGTSSNSSLTSAANNATTLLNDPNFQSLEKAVTGGDAATIKAAWATLVSNAATSAANTATNAVTIAATSQASAAVAMPSA